MATPPRVTETPIWTESTVGGLRWLVSANSGSTTVDRRTTIAALVLSTGLLGAATVAVGSTPLGGVAPSIAIAGAAVLATLTITEAAASGRPLGFVGGLVVGAVAVGR